MSHKLINRNLDLSQLRDEGYDIEIKAGYLLVKDVPYVNSSKEIKRGTLVSTLSLAGEITVKPDTHVAYLTENIPAIGMGQRY